MLEAELEKLGLTKGESKIYEALVILGSSKVGPIVKKSGVAYSNAYEVLQRLMEKGLVTFISKGKVKFFQAIEPNRMLEYLNKQEAELENRKQVLSRLLPQLNKLRELKGTTEQVEMFIGTKGLRSAYERLLKDAKKGGRLLYFSTYQHGFIEQADIFYNKVYELFKEKSIMMNGISSSKTTRKSPKFIKEKHVGFPTPGNIDIFNDKVLILSWGAKPIGVLVESPEIAENFKDYFQQIWKTAK